jgi:hypothetical protein
MTPNACPCAGRQAGNLYVVMEHCRYGELDTFIRYRAAAARPFSEDEVMFMCAMGSKGVRMKRVASCKRFHQQRLKRCKRQRTGRWASKGSRRSSLAPPSPVC